MNKAKLKDLFGKHVRLWPTPQLIRVDESGQIALELYDRNWLVAFSSMDKLRLEEMQSDRLLEINRDAVREFLSDSTTAGSDGFLKLKVRYTFGPDGTRMYPLPVGETEEEISRESGLLESTLSFNAWRLAQLLNARSELGVSQDLFMTRDDVMTALGITDREATIAATELESMGYAALAPSLTEAGPSFHHVSPTARFFWETDPLWRGWHPRQDARTLARLLVKASDHAISVPTSDQALRFGPRRVNPAVSFLVDCGYADGNGIVSSDGYGIQVLYATRNTLMFVEKGC